MSSFCVKHGTVNHEEALGTKQEGFRWVPGGGRGGVVEEVCGAVGEFSNSQNVAGRVLIKINFTAW